MEKMTVDEFIDARVLPEFWPVVALIRQLMKECAPDAVESISYGIPAYKIHKIFAVISPTKVDITLSFSHGIEFEDRYGLLRGVGKVGRHVKIKSVEKAPVEAIRDYIRQAVERDARGN
jgi:hypothetical protein